MDDIQRDDAHLLNVDDRQLEGGLGAWDKAEAEVPSRHDTKVRSLLWIALATTSITTGRRALTTDFPYPISLSLLLQMMSCLYAVVAFLYVRLTKKKERKPKSIPGRRSSRSEIAVMAASLAVAGLFSSLASIAGAGALRHYTSLPVLVMLPILTYVFDGLILRLANLMQVREANNWQENGKLALVITCVSLAIYDDYKLSVEGLFLALLSTLCVSVSKFVTIVAPKIAILKDSRCQYSRLLFVNIPPLLVTAFLAFNFEDVRSAAHITLSWRLWDIVWLVCPATIQYILYGSYVNTAYPYENSEKGLGGALDDGGDLAKTAVRSTLQAGLCVLSTGAFAHETAYVDWLQLFAFSVLYVAAVGPKHIAFYPARFFNFIYQQNGLPQLQITSSPWHRPLMLIIVSVTVGLLLAVNSAVWTNRIGYNRNVKTWWVPCTPRLDNIFRHPHDSMLDIIIAHRNGDAAQSISGLLNAFSTIPSVRSLSPRVRIYTKAPSLTNADLSTMRTTFKGEISREILHNSGDVIATYLYHILSNWDNLAAQTIFLSTSSSVDPATSAKRLRTYFVPAASQPNVTGFLNLGEYETCHCTDCSDKHGWSDTFNLVASMSSAAYPGSECNSVLLTYGNNFVVTPDRIRGVGKDVWQMLYDALVNEDMGNAWAHDPKKLPRLEVGSIGVIDSLEEPYLGHTVERLWAILMQCSTYEIAWKCPSISRGRRRGGDKNDCGCTHG